ncbi:MAG: cupin domain-containing protein [Gammaproteobacteria bacterium]|nr:cupin domain-containing protein [Gammaproteobacteria bacterium]MBI5616650.1 cupin domain-containing protein [Gammaproteobacteria bacterium]
MSSTIKVVDVKDAEVYEDATVVSRRVVRKVHGAQGMSFNVTTLKEGYHDAAVTYPGHDEIVYVLSGTVELTIAGESRVVGPGTAIYVPRGQTYGYKVLSGPNEVIATFTPARF